MSITCIYKFNATHDYCPEYNYHREPIEVHACKGYDVATQTPFIEGYSALHADLGCSKTYRTPEMAIRMMLRDHGCHNVNVHTTEEEVA